MLTSMIALFFLFMAAAGLSGLLNRRMEECLPVSFSGMVIILALFYCIGVIRMGTVILCAGMAALFLAAARKQGIGNLLHKVFTPGTAVYLAICVLYVAVLSRNYVSRHDELRLWGAVPKAIHMTGALQLGASSPIFATMQSYVPGQPMLSYFFSAFSKEFAEGALFVAYACASIVFMLPALANWTQKNKAMAAPAGLLLLLTPMVFTPHFGDIGLFGMTLFVDPLLGIVSGYCFYYASRKPFRDRFSLMAFCLGLGLLCLLKSSGALFAAAALVCAVVLDRAENWKRYACPVLMMAVTAGGWQLLLKAYRVTELVPLEVHRMSAEAVKNVLHALVSENMIAYRVPLGFLLSFAFLFVVLMAVLVWLLWLRNGKKWGSSIVIGCAITVVTVAFIYGYALIYGETLDSFQRYLSTVMLCLFTGILLTGLPMCGEGPVYAWFTRRKRGFLTVASCLCILFGAAVFIIWCMVFPKFSDREALDAAAEEIREAVMQDWTGETTACVYLVMAGDGVENSHDHHRIFFDLISEDMMIRNGFAQTQVVVPGLENPAEQWAEELRGGYDYVYLYSVEDALVPVFAELSADVPTEKTLYCVTDVDTGYGVTLRMVS